MLRSRVLAKKVTYASNRRDQAQQRDVHHLRLRKIKGFAVLEQQCYSKQDAGLYPVSIERPIARGDIFEVRTWVHSHSEFIVNVKSSKPFRGELQMSYFRETLEQVVIFVELPIAYS